METEIGKMKHGFNEVHQECQETTNLITDTLTDDIQDRLKEAEDALSSVTQKLKDQDDTIILLK
jgi:archaellum component FlaC